MNDTKLRLECLRLAHDISDFSEEAFEHAVQIYDWVIGGQAPRFKIMGGSTCVALDTTASLGVATAWDLPPDRKEH